MLVRKIQNESRRAEGLGNPEKPRVARDDDQWLVGQRWVMVDLPRVDGEPLVQSKVAWGVGKGDVWVERSEMVLKQVILGIRASRPIVKEAKPKASPKRRGRRFLRRRPSAQGHFSCD